MTTWSVLQSNSAGSGTVTSLGCQYTGNLTAGTKLLAVTCTDEPGTATSGISDGAGHSFTKIRAVTISGSNGELSLWVLDTPAGDVGTRPTITASYSGGGVEPALLIQEVSGLATGTGADGTPGASTGAGTGSIGPPVYASSAAGEYLAYAYGDDGFNQTFTGPAGGYTLDPKSAAGGGNWSGLGVAYKSSTSGTESGAWTLSGFEDWALILVALPLASGGGSATVTPASLACTTAFPGPALTAGEAVTAAVLACTVAFPAPALSTSETAAPAVLAVSASFAAPAPGTGETVAPGVLPAAASFPGPALSAGQAVATAVLSGTAAFPAPAVSAGGSATVTPAALAVSAVFTAAGLTAGETVTTAVLAATVTFPAPQPNAGSTAQPPVLSAPAAFPAPSVHAGQAVITAVLAVTASFPAPAAQAGASLATAAVACTVTFPAPAVTSGSNATVTPAFLPATASFPAPAAGGGAVAQLAVLAVTTTFTAPGISVTTGALVTLAALPGTAAFPAVAIFAGLGTPAFIAWALGGTTFPLAALAGQLSQQAAYGGTAETMAAMASSQNLVAMQGNDSTFGLALTQSGAPLNLTGLTLRLYVKATETTPDSSATIYTTGAGLTVTAALGGQVTFELPHAAAATAGTQWWRIDVTDTHGNIGTCIYGSLYIVAV